ncbi:hypothetical protein [Labrys monachus]|uniref:Uncharacterized protein n=1 Tax=Labrys monachus TaxID=217067 RepID=A0ABU0FN52_9HYPH|nr:hypothetical protein [Labrys monachus]MDQ0395896.1 hypothetical protein [Labrys monachus]
MISLTRSASALLLVLLLPALSVPAGALARDASCGDGDPRVEGFRNDMRTLKDDLFAKEAALRSNPDPNLAKNPIALCEVTKARIAFFARMRDFVKVCPNLPHLKENVTKSAALLSKLQQARAVHCR